MTSSASQFERIPIKPGVSSKHSSFYRQCFDGGMNVLYRSIGLLDRILPSRKAPPTGKPLRVFRLSSVIAQGGVAKVCLQTLLATDPSDSRIHLEVFDSKFPLPDILLKRKDIEVRRRRLNIWLGSYNRRVFRNILKLAFRMRKFRPDIVHVHEPQFAPVVRMASILAGKPAVFVHLHNDYNKRWETRPPSPVQGRLIKDALKKSNLIACSTTIREAGALWLDLPVEALHLVEDGSDDIRAAREEDRLASDLPKAAEGRKVIVKMSHIIGHKRIDDYMAACRILLDEGYPIFVLLMCYGKRSARRILRRQFECMFAPWEGDLLLHVADPQALLKHCAIGVSTSALEGLGLNILEFQMAGLPVVCTNLQPHREMVEDGSTGLLFETGDVPQLVAHLRALLKDESAAKRLGEAGRESASKRTWKKTAQRTLEVYRQVLK